MENRLRYSALLAGLLCSASCSGGGGSSTSGTVASAPMAAAAAKPVVSLQAAGTTVIYQAASATALVTSAGTGGVASAASGQGATITLIDDASGVFKVALNIPTTGATFTQQYIYNYWDGDDWGFPIGLSDTAPFAPRLVTILREIYGFPNTTGLAITQSVGTSQTLNSAAYGLWASGDTATVGRAGTFAFGNLTPTASVPTTGSATFTGSTMGVGGATSGSTVYALQGKAQIIANFSTHSVSTNLTNLGTQNISTNAVSSLPDLSGTSSISGNAYAGSIAGTGLAGTINGNFYGSAAQETAGVWQASGGGNSWIGSYGAK